MSPPPPPRGGFIPVPTADLDKIMKFARLADPDLNPEQNERNNASRLLHKALQALITLPPRYGGASSSSSSAPPPPRPPPPPPRPPPAQCSNGVAPILRLWQQTLGRVPGPGSIDMLEEFVAQLGQHSVLGASRYAIDNQTDPAEAWRFFANICRKRIREKG